MKLSVIILTKGEESLNKAIESVEWAEEIIIILDENSKFQALNSKQYSNLNLKIYRRKLNGDFAGQRNFAAEKARGEWILYLDADEIVSGGLKEEILKLAQNDNENNAYYLKRRDWFWGRELQFGEVSKVRNEGLIRLIRKGSGTWYGNVHEVFQSSRPVGQLEGFIEHYPHPTIKEFLEDINFYSTLRARELLNQGRSVGILTILAYPFGKFLSNYFLKLGFLDGPAGFVYAFMMSFHSFLVRAKLYQYKKLDK